MAQLDQQYIKSTNLKTLFHLIQKNRGISRATLAKVTNLSKTTVSALVDELIMSGYIMDCGTDVSIASGRKPTKLSVNATQNNIAIFHFHRNWLNAALVNLNNEVIFELRISKTVDMNYVQSAVSLFHNELETHDKNARILGICIIVPAIIDQTESKIVSTVLDSALPNNAIDQLKQNFTDYPLIILNDTSCYAYAECLNKKMDDEYFAFVNIGHGVGAVLLDHGKMFRRANGMTTQFGHFSVDRNGELCSCGNRGCLERRIGETVLYDRAVKEGLEKLFPNRSKSSFAALKEQADANNPDALRLMDVLAEDLAYSIGNLISLFNPEEVVIGGNGTVLGQHFLDAVIEGLKHSGFQQFVKKTAIRFSSLDKSSAIRGSAQYFIDRYYSFDGKEQNHFYIG